MQASAEVSVWIRHAACLLPQQLLPIQVFGDLHVGGETHLHEAGHLPIQIVHAVAAVVTGVVHVGQSQAVREFMAYHPDTHFLTAP